MTWKRQMFLLSVFTYLYLSRLYTGFRKVHINCRQKFIKFKIIKIKFKIETVEDDATFFKVNKFWYTPWKNIIQSQSTSMGVALMFLLLTIHWYT